MKTPEIYVVRFNEPTLHGEKIVPVMITEAERNLQDSTLAHKLSARLTHIHNQCYSLALYSKKTQSRKDAILAIDYKCITQLT